MTHPLQVMGHVIKVCVVLIRWKREERDTELECEDGKWDGGWEGRWWSGGCGRGEVGRWQRMREDIHVEKEEECRWGRRKREGEGQLVTYVYPSSQACPGSGQRGEPSNNANILTTKFLSGGSGGMEACGGRVTCNRKQSFLRFFEIVSRRLSLHAQTHKY